MSITVSAPAQKAENSAVSVVVVAGGKSVRLGQDKRRLRLWGPTGPTMLEHTLGVLAAFSDDLIVVMNDPETWPGLQARVTGDLFPVGALGGIYSGLVAARHDYSFVIAADMPLISAGMIAWMIAQPRDYDVLLPRVGGGRARNKLGVESLHAIYSARCCEPMRQQLAAGNPQVIGFFPHVRVRMIEPDVIGRFDRDGVAFKNINTPDDLEEVKRLLHTGILKG